MAGNLNVELGVGKVLLFAFDPGGNTWFHNGKQHLDNAFKPRFDVAVENVLTMVRKYQYKTMLKQTEEYDIEHYNRQNGLDRIWRLIPGGIMLKVIGASLRSRYWIEYFLIMANAAVLGPPELISIMCLEVSMPKQYLSLLRHLIALYSFYTFYRMTEVKEIVEVCDPSYRDIFEDTKHKITVDFKFAMPGKGRQDYVYSGWDVEKVLNDGLLIGAVVLGVPAKATIKEAGKDDECSPCEAWLDNFVWDPSQCAIFAYILEDKDVFERVGNNRDTTLEIIVLIMIGNVEKSVLDPKNLSTLWSLLLASLHDIGRIKSADGGNVLAIIYHSFEFLCDSAYNHHMESLFTFISQSASKDRVAGDTMGILEYFVVSLRIFVLVILENFSPNHKSLNPPLARIWDGDMYFNSINGLQHSGYVTTMNSHKEMLRTFKLLCLWKHQWGCSKAFVLVTAAILKSFVWDPGPVWAFISPP